MCGIYAVISDSAQIASSTTISTDLKRCLCKRGPDYLGEVATQYESDGRTIRGSFTSTVLSLRGDHVTKQPFVDGATGSILCWNGEAWKIRGQDVEGNDGQAVFKLLTTACMAAAGSSEAPVLEALRSIEGPFAFVFLDRVAGRLYFSRDRLGRRSLLIYRDDRDQHVILSSVAQSIDERWREVEADGVYVLDLGRPHDGDALCGGAWIGQITRHDWMRDGADFISSIGRFNDSLPSSASALTSESPSVRQLRDRLIASLRPRLLSIPERVGQDGVDQPRVAVLFSGGLDCTVLARMSHDILPPEQGVDLLNVAFENPRIASHLSKQGQVTVDNLYEACPDRITGRKSFTELQAVCPGRTWRFIAVNIPYAETVSHRSQIVCLIHPHNTEMDLSIAYALYFSARGQGLCYTSPAANPYQCTTSARVLLSGLGADELFGGYGRHAVAYSKDGYRGLIEELKLDVSRLGKRNLGRDDRVIGHWGREVRFPYLDEELVQWAIERPVWEKCDFANAGEGAMAIEPGKRVLRLLAAELGMKDVAREKKRAIQFGARTAKMESGRVKGTTLIAS